MYDKTEENMETKKKKMRYVAGRDDLALTVFVPWKCGKACPFCNIRKDYDTLKLNKAATINSLKQVVFSKLFLKSGIKDVVISGGEPLNDLTGLLQILEPLVPFRENGRIRVFVNTSLPEGCLSDTTCLRQTIGVLRLFDGINVSYHYGLEGKEKALSLLSILPLKDRIRINTMAPADRDETFIDWLNVVRNLCSVINIRADYTKINGPGRLKGDDGTVHFLASNLDYIRSSGCLVCQNDRFEMADGFPVVYHRGLDESSVWMGDSTLVVNDIVIQPDGLVTIGWGRDKPAEELLKSGFDWPVESEMPKTRPAEKCFGSSTLSGPGYCGSPGCGPGQSDLTKRIMGNWAPCGEHVRTTCGGCE